MSYSSVIQIENGEEPWVGDMQLCKGCGGLVAESCLTLATLWTVACQAPLSMEILRARILEWVAILSSQKPL